MGRFRYGFENLSDRTARIVLLELCRDNTTMSNKVYGLLMKLEKKGNVLHANGDESHICSSCNGTYAEERNNDTACQFHDGEERSPMSGHQASDSFVLLTTTALGSLGRKGADPDENPDGDDEWYEKENNPQYFWWSCCGKQGNGDLSLGPDASVREGCVKRRHMTSKELREYRSKQDAGSVDSTNSASNNEDDNRKRPVMADAEDSSAKRLAVPADTAASEGSSSGGKVVPVPVVVAPSTAADTTGAVGGSRGVWSDGE